MSILRDIQSRFDNAHPDHHRIARGMIVVAMFVFLGKLAGAAKEMAIAYRYGISQEVDAFLFVFNLVTWPVGVWFSVLIVVLVPLATGIRHKSMNIISHFRSELLGFSFLLGFGLMIFLWIILSWLLKSSWVGLPSSSAKIAREIVPNLVFLVPLGVLISLMSAWMLSIGRQSITFLESLPAVVLLIVVLVLPNAGIGALVWGTIAGFAAHLISLLVPLAIKGEIEMPRFTFQSSEWAIFWHGFGIMMAGQLFMSLIGIVDQFYAAHLDAGTISTLSYANRVLALALGLGATAISRSILPVLSKAQAIGSGFRHLQQVANYWMLILFVLGIISTVLGWFLSPWVIELLFERGAFTSSDTSTVAEVLRLGLFQLPFYFSGIVLVSLLASRGNHSLIAISGIVNLFVKIMANSILIPFMGINGIIMATTIMYMSSLALLYWFVKPEFLEK